MKNIELLEEMLHEQEDIIEMTQSACNKSKYEGLIQALQLLGYDYVNGKVFQCEN
jgi:hypothetical protein